MSLAGVESSLGPVTPSHHPFPLSTRTSVTVVCVAHHCMLEAGQTPCPWVGGPQVGERTVPSTVELHRLRGPSTPDLHDLDDEVLDLN